MIEIGSRVRFVPAWLEEYDSEDATARGTVTDIEDDKQIWYFNQLATVAWDDGKTWPTQVELSWLTDATEEEAR